MQPTYQQHQQHQQPAAGYPQQQYPQAYAPPLAPPYTGYPQPGYAQPVFAQQVYAPPYGVHGGAYGGYGAGPYAPVAQYGAGVQYGGGVMRPGAPAMHGYPPPDVAPTEAVITLLHADTKTKMVSVAVKGSPLPCVNRLICDFFIRFGLGETAHSCLKTASCPYHHPLNIAPNGVHTWRICQDFFIRRRCLRGETCHQLHPTGRVAHFTAVKFGMFTPPPEEPRPVGPVHAPAPHYAPHAQHAQHAAETARTLPASVVTEPPVVVPVEPPAVVSAPEAAPALDTQATEPLAETLSPPLTPAEAPVLGTLSESQEAEPTTPCLDSTVQ
jgi:hypothetical protein